MGPMPLVHCTSKRVPPAWIGTCSSSPRQSRLRMQIHPSSTSRCVDRGIIPVTATPLNSTVCLFLPYSALLTPLSLLHPSPPSLPITPILPSPPPPSPLSSLLSLYSVPPPSPPFPCPPFMSPLCSIITDRQLLVRLPCASHARTTSAANATPCRCLRSSILLAAHSTHGKRGNVQMWWHHSGAL